MTENIYKQFFLHNDKKIYYRLQYSQTYHTTVSAVCGTGFQYFAITQQEKLH